MTNFLDLFPKDDAGADIPDDAVDPAVIEARRLCGFELNEQTGEWLRKGNTGFSVAYAYNGQVRGVNLGT